MKNENTQNQIITSEEDYFIGQIFLESYPPEVSDWCLENNAYIAELDPTPEENIRRFEIREIEIIPPTPERQRQQRKAAYERFVDSITAHIERLKDEDPTDEIITKINELRQERTLKVQEIKNKYPID